VTGPRYDLSFRPAALRRLRKLDPQVVRRIKTATTDLCADPRPHGAKALSGQHGWLRIRVGDYRIIYEVRDSELTVLIIQIGHRSQVYER
jgi:mRNA interferase RelE/StbE